MRLSVVKDFYVQEMKRVVKELVRSSEEKVENALRTVEKAKDEQMLGMVMDGVGNGQVRTMKMTGNAVRNDAISKESGADIVSN